MAGYQPLYIKGNEVGLVQERENFILPNDAYPILENAYIWRERIKRKQGCELLGRLQRALTTESFGNVSASGAGTFTFNIITGLIAQSSITAGETNAEISPGNLNNISIVIASPINQTLTDTAGTGTLTITGAGSITAAFLSYSTGNLILTFSGAAGSSAATFTGSYYPGLPVMGLRTEELADSAFDQSIAFDQVYAYIYNSASEQFEEFLGPGVTWTGSNSQFMWTTNYWLSNGNFKIFWATNNNDPIRYTNGQSGTTWYNFAPIISNGGNTLTNCLTLLPFRNRLVAFNTTESGAGGGVFTNRIRWAAIGNPFTVTSAIVTTVNANAWNSNMRGQGGFLDMPTSEDIVSVGFVRDNCVIYCEKSTWQLRYTGRTIAPFQIERVNSELGVESTFSSIQFDTSLVGIGNRGVVECDSYKSEQIDIKIPDLVYNFENTNNGQSRVYGIRDFVNRLAYWCYPSSNRMIGTDQPIYPDKRLVYNYENDSWAIYDDSFTCFGTFQTAFSPTWLSTPYPWVQINWPWITEPNEDPVVIAGNQQGFVEQLTNQLDAFSVNDVTLSITDITANSPNPTTVTSPNHNLQTGTIIEISGIISGTPFTDLNGGVFFVQAIDANNFNLYLYNPIDDAFSTPQVDVATTPYLGTGKIAIRDNFNVTSKKFNFVDEGQSIQFGYLDLLAVNNTSINGEISLNVYINYQDDQAVNTIPQNVIGNGSPTIAPDEFFNATIPLSQSTDSNVSGSKFWQRVFCPVRGNFITLQYTFSNSQMAGLQQTSDVQIDAQVLWMRKAGRLTQF
jgi:hypothetical protein